jgi:hypothetical protein
VDRAPRPRQRRRSRGELREKNINVNCVLPTIIDTRTTCVETQRRGSAFGIAARLSLTLHGRPSLRGMSWLRTTG